MRSNPPARLLAVLLLALNACEQTTAPSTMVENAVEYGNGTERADAVELYRVVCVVSTCTDPNGETVLWDPRTGVPEDFGCITE